MELWHLWIILGIVLIIAEMFSLSFYLLIFAIAVFASGILDLLGASLYWQILIAAAIGGILAPFLPKLLKSKFQGKGRSSLMAGESGEIEGQIVENPAGGWLVKYHGDTYPYKFADKESTFELSTGLEVKIIRFDGITAIITRL